MLNANRGFTLIEVIVVIACIALLAGIIAPLAFQAIEDAKISRAEADISAICSALGRFNRDVGEWPTRDAQGNLDAIERLVSTSDGTITGADYGQGLSNVDVIDNHLMMNDNDRYTTTAWDGAYMESIKLDPWEKSYEVYVIGFHANNQGSTGETFSQVWVVSGGPDGVITTNFSDTGQQQNPGLDGDDIGRRMK